VLFKMWAWPGLADGSITATFRRWTRPQAKVGGHYRTPAGMLHVHAVALVPVARLTAGDASAAGFPSLDALLDHLGEGPPEVWRVDFSFAGADPRTALREAVPDSDAELDTIVARLARLDRASAIGPWTAATLQLIADHPETRAGDLAESVARDMPTFKLDVRKLKALGLTESLTRGYRISPRGAAVLARLDPEGR
jgi:hypothetical protein